MAEESNLRIFSSQVTMKNTLRQLINKRPLRESNISLAAALYFHMNDSSEKSVSQTESIMNCVHGSYGILFIHQYGNPDL